MYEIEHAFFTETPKFTSKKPYSKYYLKLHWNDIRRAYDTLFKSLLNDSAISEEENRNLSKALSVKKCIFCDGNLNYIESYNFWGCENYKDGRKHTTFSGYEPTFYQRGVHVNHQWITDLLKKADLNEKVKATDCLEFLLQNGYEDLRIKYGYEATNPSKSWDIAKINSDKLELSALEYLRSKWHTVHYQECIAYKYVGCKESYCIPDFICTNKYEVCIYETKLGYVKDEQLDLYCRLVEFIMNGLNDKRRFDAWYIMPHTDDSNNYFPFGSDTPYPIYYI